MNKPSTCPHFGICSGCELKDPYNPPLWQEASQFFQSLGVLPTLITDGFSHTRMRAKLAIRPGPTIGLFKKNSHEVISIPHCLVHHPSINLAVSILNEEIFRQKISCYRESSQGLLRYAQFFVERVTNKVQLTLVATKPIEAFCKSLMKYDLWHSIWQNIHEKPSNAVFGPKWELIAGLPFLWQPIGQKSFPFHPAAFSQVHLPLFEKMIEKIQSWVAPNDSVLELYAGVGVIGLSLNAKKLTLVENNPYAKLSFGQLHLDTPYFCTDAKEVNLAGYDVTIVDPPRKGLDCDMIPRLESKRLIYVSCNFSTFKRDVEKLIALGWRVKEGAGFLLFPGTNHVEIVSYLECDCI